MPGLSSGALDDHALAVTTDYRDVLSEILVERMSTPDLGEVFPGHTPQALGIVG